MGQVYRARDAALNRDVALKIMPEAFASGPDRLARFTREEETLASLNRPNIAAIYGVEESQHVRPDPRPRESFSRALAFIARACRFLLACDLTAESGPRAVARDPSGWFHRARIVNLSPIVWYRAM